MEGPSDEEKLSICMNMMQMFMAKVKDKIEETFQSIKQRVDIIDHENGKH